LGPLFLWGINPEKVWDQNPKYSAGTSGAKDISFFFEFFVNFFLCLVEHGFGGKFYVRPETGSFRDRFIFLVFLDDIS
jgi:hypothetical protein